MRDRRPRSRLITISAVTPLRWLISFNWTNTRPGIDRAAAGEAHDVIHGRIVLHDVDERRQLLAHGREGDVLRADDGARQAAGVLLREEALGHDDVEVHVQGDGQQGDEQRGQRMAQHPRQRAVVEIAAVQSNARSPAR